MGRALVRPTPPPSLPAPMDTLDTIRQRRSTKSFTAAPVSREQVAALLDLVVLAPNHRLSAPWRFVVMGPGARRAYGEALGRRKAKKVEAEAAAQAIIEKTAAEAVAAPAMIGVVQRLADNPEVAEEDYAAIWMGIENLLLGATAQGLGSHLRTGAVLGDPAVRAPLDIAEGERLVALVLLGVPASEAAARERVPAADRTTWLG